MICEKCGNSAVSNGKRTVSYRDLVGDVSVTIEATVSRCRCKACGGVTAKGEPALQPGFRVTPRLFDAVALDACTRPFSEVAETYGLGERTVAGIWEAWAADTADNPSYPLRSELLSRSDGLCLAVDRSTHIPFAAFDGPSDPAFARWLERHTGGVVLTDCRMAPITVRHSPANVTVACSRLSLLEWIDVNVAVFCAKARQWMDRDERRILRSLEDIVTKGEAARTLQEDLALAEAVRNPGLVARFVRALEGLRSVWKTDDASVAERRYAKWQNGLDTFGSEVFAAAMRMVASLKGIVFTKSSSEAPMSRVPLRGVPESASSEAVRKAIVGGLKSRVTRHSQEIPPDRLATMRLDSF